MGNRRRLRRPSVAAITRSSRWVVMKRQILLEKALPRNDPLTHQASFAFIAKYDVPGVDGDPMAPDNDAPPDAAEPAPDAAPAEGGELGFNAGAKRPERYNTQFLVANFEKEERRTRLILLGVAVLCAVLIGVGLTVGKDEVK